MHEVPLGFVIYKRIAFFMIGKNLRINRDSLGIRIEL